MFKKLLFCGGIALTSVFAPVFADIAKAEENKGWYFTAGAGINDIQDTDWEYTTGGTKYTGEQKYDGGFSSEVGFGYDFGNRWRTELTWTRDAGDLDAVTVDNAGVSVTGDFDVRIDAIGLGAYYDLSEDTKFTPYIGGGIGWAKVTTEDGTIAGVNVEGGSEEALGYQFKVGGSYSLDDSKDVYIEGGYAGTEDITSNDVKYSNIGAWVGRVGMRFKF